MKPKPTSLPWLESNGGRDKRLQKGDLDLHLFDLAGEDKDQYMNLLGLALRDEIRKVFGDQGRLLVAPKEDLTEKCLSFLGTQNLWTRQLTTKKFICRAVENFIKSRGKSTCKP